jgi:hypothetical protein
MKIRRKKCKKRYLGGKYVYEYVQLLVCLPSKYHQSVYPLLEKDFDTRLKVENNKIHIVMEARENVSVFRK